MLVVVLVLSPLRILLVLPGMANTTHAPPTNTTDTDKTAGNKQYVVVVAILSTTSPTNMSDNTRQH
jgi:hypothetical protein